VIADMLRNSLLDPREIERERLVVINEIRSYLDSPDDCAYDAFFEGLWGDHPLAWKITGEAHQVEQLSRDSLEKFYRTRFLKGPLMVAVAGDVRQEDVVPLLEKHLAGWETQACDSSSRRPPERRYDRRLVKTRFKQDQIYVGTDFSPVTGNIRSIYDTLVFSTAVGESMSSRLFQELRESRGLCYSVGSFRTIFSDASAWSIYASTTPAQTSALLEAIDSELAKLLSKPLSDQEVADAVAHLRGGLVLSKSDMESRMKRLVRLETLFGRPLEYEESLAHLLEVTASRAREVSAELLKGQRLNVTAYGGRRLKNWKEMRFAY
jgi:predicted Zn-dependent peptidase